MNFPSLLSRFLPLAAILFLVFAPLSPLAANRADESSEKPTLLGTRSSAGMMLLMASEAYGNNNETGALRLYRRVIRQHGTSIHAPEAHFQSALIRIDRKQWSKAFDHLQEIVENYPDYPGFSQVIQTQYDIALAIQKGARLRLFWRVPGLRSPERAVEYYEQIVENAPFHEVSPSALLSAAAMQADVGKLDEAIELYDRFISDYPNHERTADAYFGLAEAFSTRVRGPAYDQGANREAITYYEDFMLLNPNHPRAEEARERIAEMRDILAQSRVVLGDFYFFRRDNYTAARIFYNEAISISPNSPSADEAREKLVRVEKEAESVN